MKKQSQSSKWEQHQIKLAISEANDDNQGGTA